MSSKNFELESSFLPTGDQPEAIKKLVDGINNGETYQVLLGATGTGKTFTISNVIKEVNKPMVLIALQPRAALDYTKASTFMQLENDNICSVPEFIGVAIRLGKKVNDVVIGCLYDDKEAEKAFVRCRYPHKSARGSPHSRGRRGHPLRSLYRLPRWGSGR